MKSKDEFSSDQEYNKYLRAYFAAMAMQGILANGNEMIPKSGAFDTWNYWDIAQTSVKAADEILKALES